MDEHCECLIDPTMKLTRPFHFWSDLSVASTKTSSTTFLFKNNLCCSFEKPAGWIVNCHQGEADFDEGKQIVGM